MEKVIIETMLSESQGRERVARKVIEDLRKQIEELKKLISKEVRVILTPIDDVKSLKDFENMSGKEIYDQAEKNGYDIYSDKIFCNKVNNDEIDLNTNFITITKDY